MTTQDNPVSTMLGKLNRFVARVRRGVPNRIARLLAYRQYRAAFGEYFARVKNQPRDRGGVLFVAGRGMNPLWAQIWTYLSLAFIRSGYQVNVVLLRGQSTIEQYFELAKAQLIWLDDYTKARTSGFEPAVFAACKTVEQWTAVRYHSLPIGQIILSTFTRYRARGLIEVNDPELLPFASSLAAEICSAYDSATEIFRKHNIKKAVFTETFIEEYGGIFYAALDAGLDIIKTSGTVRDEAIIVHRKTGDTERLHHASLAAPTWQFVKAMPRLDRVKARLDQNFADRYSDRWRRSSRNQAGASFVTREEGRASLGIPDDRKVVIIFSHILYDALFHYGDELFRDYATWLRESAKIAVTNPNVDWFIKLHPSNLWRGEFQSQLKGQFEEERVLADVIKNLPSHVKLIYPDTKISPYGWYQIADYGISVRGTSGLEMACLGKTVITAGTGRYEGNGFTVDPPTIEEYRSILATLPKLAPLTSEQIELAQRYADGIFNLKPFTLENLDVRVAFGRKQVKLSDDLYYVPRVLKGGEWPRELVDFEKFIGDRSRIDLMASDDTLRE